jgi:PilZ domain-containing protein
MTGFSKVEESALPREGMLGGSGTTIMKERRTSQRFKAKPGSAVSYVEGAAAIGDVSMDGLFLLDSEPLPVGTKFTFSLMLGRETASFQGIVRRSLPGKGMGVQFTETHRELRRRLLSHVASLPLG